MRQNSVTISLGLSAFRGDVFALVDLVDLVVSSCVDSSVRSWRSGLDMVGWEMDLTGSLAVCGCVHTIEKGGWWSGVIYGIVERKAIETA